MYLEIVDLFLIGLVLFLIFVIKHKLKGSTDLREYLTKPKCITIYGVKFKINKISPLNFIEGTQAIQQIFQSYEDKRNPGKANLKQIKQHYSDVFMSSVKYPKLTRKDPKEDELLVDNLFSDWSLATSLYDEIINYSYGKKKF